MVAEVEWDARGVFQSLPGFFDGQLRHYGSLAFGLIGAVYRLVLNGVDCVDKEGFLHRKSMRGLLVVHL